jgi:thiol-disulfide isomerase/thioredoxin
MKRCSLELGEVALICVIYAFGALGLSAQTPPANDDFVNATRLAGDDVSTTGSNVGATKEPGEPPHADNPGGKSVWWTWTAAKSGYVTISTLGSVTTNGIELDTLLGVYTGSAVEALTAVADDDDSEDSSTYTSKVILLVTAGTTYFIAVDGYAIDTTPADEGTIQLRLQFSTASPYPPAPEWTLPDSNGAIVRSTDFAGKVVLLNFWATWCGPCIAETPDLVALHDQYAKDGFTVIGVSVDDAVGGAPPANLVKSFATDYAMDYPVVMARPGSSIEFDYGGIPATPTSFIIDRQNNIAMKVVGSNTRSYYENLIRPLLYANLRTETQLSPNGLRLSWPVTQATVVVESTDRLDAPQWQEVNATSQTEGANEVVTLPTGGSTRFYRLRMQ